MSIFNAFDRFTHEQKFLKNFLQCAELDRKTGCIV